MTEDTQATPAPALSAEQELAAAFLSGVDDGDSQPEIAVEASPEAAPEGAQPPAASPSPTGEEPKAPAPEWSPREFTFTRNGQQVSLKPSSPEEELEFIRKGYDYTQKTMEVAEERKKLQAIAKELHERELQRQESIRAFFSDKAKIARYLELMGGTPAAPPHTPENPSSDDDIEPVSKAELAKLREELIAEADRRADEKSESKVKAILQEVAKTQMETEFRSEIDSTLKTLVTERFPILSNVEGIEMLIRADGKKAFDAEVILNGPEVPVDPRKVHQAMLESAQRRAEKLQAHLREKEKLEAVERATLTTRGPEPPGGNAPLPPQTKKMRLNDPELDAQVVREIQSIMGSGR